MGQTVFLHSHFLTPKGGTRKRAKSPSPPVPRAPCLSPCPIHPIPPPFRTKVNGLGYLSCYLHVAIPLIHPSGHLWEISCLNNGDGWSDGSRLPGRQSHRRGGARPTEDYRLLLMDTCATRTRLMYTLLAAFVHLPVVLYHKSLFRK